MKLTYNALAFSITFVATASFAFADEAAGSMDEHGVRALSAVANVHAGGEQGEGGVASGIPSWSALGPFGGDVQDVARSPVDSNLMLAGVAPAGSSGGAMFRSTDGGAAWVVVSGFSSTSVYDVEFAPDGTVYAGTIDSVRKSTNGGVSWTTLALDIGLNDQVFDVAIDPNNSSVLWIGIADAIGGQPVNVMQSIDGGATWTNRTPPLSAPVSCRALAVNPANSLEIYAGFGGALGGGNLWVSFDGGLSWENRSAGLPNTPINDLVHDGTRVLVCGGQQFGSQNFGLFESINQGLTWTALHDGSWPSLIINDIAVDPNNAATVYVVSPTAGTFRSVNGGTWEFGVGGTGSLSLLAVRFAPASSTHILLGANSTGVLQSTNGGGVFDITSNGISMLNVRGAASNPNNTSELAIAFEGANNGGVYTSLNGGQTWSLEPVPPTRYSNVAFAPDGTLHAISSGPSSIAPEGVYRRNRDGTWTGLGPNQGTLFESDLLMLKFSPAGSDVMLATGSDFGVAGSEATIWRSPDNGGIWTKVYEGSQPSEDVTDLEIVSETSDQSMIASFVDFSTGGDGGALTSIDGGLSWTISHTGLPFGIRGNALSPSAAGPNTFLLGDSRTGATGGLYVTTDAGQTWASSGFANQVSDVIGDPGDSQVVYILQTNAIRVQKSVDGGATFTPFNTGLAIQGSGFVNRLAYVGSALPQLLMCSANAGTWATDLEEPLPCPADIDGSGGVNVDDLLAVIAGWGGTGGPADIDADGDVDVDDLLAVIGAWGDCP
jgi:hypothetical protein